MTSTFVDVLRITDDDFEVKHTGQVTASSIFISLEINRVSIVIELDTKSAVTILSTVARRKLSAPQLRSSGNEMQSYTGGAIKMRGVTEVEVEFRKTKEWLKVWDAEKGESLSGRD